MVTVQISPCQKNLRNNEMNKGSSAKKKRQTPQPQGKGPRGGQASPKTPQRPAQQVLLSTPVPRDKKKSASTNQDFSYFSTATPKTVPRAFKKSGSLSPIPRSLPSTPVNRNASTPSPQCFAGSKIFAPPTPDALPKPPPSWVSSPANLNDLLSLVRTPVVKRVDSPCLPFTSDASQHLKLLLKVQA